MSGHILKQLEHAKRRREYARQNREAFEITADSSPQHVRSWRKLCDDEKRAEQDIGWLMHALDTPEG